VPHQIRSFPGDDTIDVQRARLGHLFQRGHGETVGVNGGL